MQNIDSGTILFFAVGCVALCIIGIGVLFSLQIFSGIVAMLSGLLQGFGTILSGGPLAWCGCILLFVICGATAVVGIWLVSILSTCGTADAVNICQLFGAG